MRKNKAGRTLGLALILISAASIPSFLWGQPAASPEKKTKMNSDADFKPHLSYDLGLHYSGQPSDQGQGKGQLTKDFSGTCTYDFDPAGHFLSFGISAGQQKVEGGTSTYGGLNLTGGLGMGIFSPSLSLQTLQGSSALNSLTAALNLSFQLFDNLNAGVNLNGGFSSHQGPVSQLLGNSDKIVEIDSKSVGYGFTVIFATSEVVSLNLSIQQIFDTTYQAQNLAHTVKVSFNQSDRIPSISLGADFVLFKDFSLDLNAQRGQEFYPAGRVYSPVLGETVDFTTPTSQYFSGFTTGINFSFQ